MYKLLGLFIYKFLVKKTYFNSFSADKIHPRKWKMNPRDFRIICNHGGKKMLLQFILFCR